MEPQGPTGTVSTLLLLLHRMMHLFSCLVAPSFLVPPHLNLPSHHQLYPHLQSQSLHPSGRNPSRASARPPPALPFPLLIVGLNHQSVQTAPPRALELCTIRQQLLWLRDKQLWGGTGVLQLLPQRLQFPRGRLWLLAPQSAPLLCVAPHLWWAALQDRTGEKGTVV